MICMHANFEFFQNLPVKSQILLHILIVPIMYECGKLKKTIGNKILFPVILEQCALIVYAIHALGNKLKNLNMIRSEMWLGFKPKSKGFQEPKFSGEQSVLGSKVFRGAKCSQCKVFRGAKCSREQSVPGSKVFWGAKCSGELSVLWSKVCWGVKCSEE